MYKIEWVNTISGREGVLPNKYEKKEAKELLYLLRNKISYIVFWMIEEQWFELWNQWNSNGKFDLYWDNPSQYRALGQRYNTYERID